MKSPTQSTFSWLTDTQVAARYGVSRVTVWRWAQQNRIPQPRKIGPNTTRWHAAELDKADARMLVNHRTQAIG